MKSNRNTVIFILIGLVLIGIVTYFWLTQKQRYTWRPTYRIGKEQPYDISLFRKTLEASYPKNKFGVVRNLQTDSNFINAENALFIYINNALPFDSTDRASLAAFADKGNRIFISTDNAVQLTSALFSECNPGDSTRQKYIDYRRAKTAGLRLNKFENDTTLPLRYMIRDEKIRFPWRYFQLGECEKSKVQILGTFEAINRDYINFIRIKSGEGAYYLQSTPLLFTNYYFKNEPTFAFVQKVLSQLPHARVFYYEPEAMTLPSAVNEPSITESPLRFILSNPSLKWAWYSILILALLFVLNSIRRRQKAIPVFTLPENETANYLDVVSRMYRKEGKHKHIIGIQEKLLRRHLQNKYRIRIKVDAIESLREASARLQLPQQYIHKVFIDIDRAKNNSTLTDEEFIKSIAQIKEFYERCP